MIGIVDAIRSGRIAALCLLVASPAAALRTEKIAQTRAAGQAPVSIEVVSERALVRFSSAATPSQRASVLGAIGAQLNGELPTLGWTAVGLPGGMTVEGGLAMLRGLPYVLDAQPDLAYRVNRIPSDPMAGIQYALSQVDAFAAWDYEVGASSRVTVAVVDSGVDATQPDLSGKMGGLAHQYCDPGADKSIGTDDAACTTVAATAACDHATRVAGVAAASSDNGTQVAGMSWGAQVLSLKVFRDADCSSDCGGASCATDDWAMANAINFAVAQQNTAAYGRIVVNMSLGSPATACSAVIQAAVTVAVAAGIPVVAAAGNDGLNVNSPGNCSGVIPMGATDNTNQVASFSSRGSQLASSGLVAPGVSVLTTDIGGKTANATGTSFSSPMGAGLAALILSARPTLTPSQVQSYMRAGAEDIGFASSVQGAGRMNAFRSLRLAVKGTLAGFDGETRPIAFPNPFRVSRSGLVSFAIPPSLAGSGAAIKIYTADGQFVRALQGLTWDAKNTDGSLVASGTYVFVVSTGKGSSRGRFSVIR